MIHGKVDGAGDFRALHKSLVIILLQSVTSSKRNESKLRRTGNLFVTSFVFCVSDRAPISKLTLGNYLELTLWADTRCRRPRELRCTLPCRKWAEVGKTLQESPSFPEASATPTRAL